MINETYKNVFFGFASLLMLVGSIKHSEYISRNVEMAENYYFGGCFGVLITCLFANICLGIFSVFILGNLNDFIQQMSVNLIGAYQKMRVLAILMTISTILYSFVNTVSFVCVINLTKLEYKMALISGVISFFQLAHLASMNAIHPDLFGLKYRKGLKTFDNGELARHIFV